MRIKSNTIRINILFLIAITLLFCAFIWKIAYVALNDVVEGVNVKELAENRKLITKTLEAKRGSIYDIYGETLAETVNSYTIVAVLSSQRTTDINNPKHVVDYNY